MADVAQYSRQLLMTNLLRSSSLMSGAIQMQSLKLCKRLQCTSISKTFKGNMFPSCIGMGTFSMEHIMHLLWPFVLMRAAAQMKRWMMSSVSFVQEEQFKLMPVQKTLFGHPLPNGNWWPLILDKPKLSIKLSKDHDFFLFLVLLGKSFLKILENKTKMHSRT